MAKVRSWAGLDVHARSVLAVTMDASTGEIRRQRLAAETATVVEFLAGLPGPTRVGYEAGPTGYGLARAVMAAGMGCTVAAPGKIERPAQDKLKTDVRDAERVLRLLMIDALVAVRVPTVEEEAIRDLVRAREDVRGDLMRWRQRLSKLLLRHGIVYEDTGSTWTARHRAWIRAQDLGGGAQVTLLDHLGAIDTLELRRGQLEAAIGELVLDSPYAGTVARLRCLRGIDTLSAAGLAAEIGDLTRFDRPGKLMSYLGLVPSENSSGETRRQGRITRTGSKHARGCSWKRAGTTRRHPPAASPSSDARKGRARRSWRSAGRPNNACTASGSASSSSAASAQRSSRSLSPASSPGSAGHSPTPTDPPHTPRRSRRAAPAPPTRESIGGLTMSNPPVAGHARS
jgi:transposase